MIMHIVKVKVGTNLNRTEINVSSNKTVREILEENDINYSTATIFIDGVTVQIGDMDKTLDELNIGASCYIIAAQKTENA
jgi:hypothetical protein